MARLVHKPVMRRSKPDLTPFPSLTHLPIVDQDVEGDVEVVLEASEAGDGVRVLVPVVIEQPEVIGAVELAGGFLDPC